MAESDRTTDPERAEDRDWLQLGTVSTAARAVIDPRGLITPGAVPWSLDWWIGADDRWHVPANEAGVRQQRLDGTPVVETAMRVPGGDAVHRAYAAQSAAGPVVVVEIENQTTVPFAVALTIVPYTPADRGAVRSITWHDATVEVDDATAIVLPKPPARVAGDCEGRTFERVTDGAAVVPESPVLAECAAANATAALIFPLPHRATLRVALPLDGRDESSRLAPASLPAADDVVRGWQAQVDRGPKLVIPDDRYRRALDAARCDLLLFHAGEDVLVWPDQPVPWTAAAQVVAALDLYGFHIEAEELLRGVADEQRLDGGIVSAGDEMGANGAVLWALAHHWQLTRDDALLEGLIGPIAKAGHWIEKRRRARRRPLLSNATPDELSWSVRGLTSMSPALVHIGQPEVAEDFLVFAARLASDMADIGRRVPDDEVTLASVVAALDDARRHTNDPRATATLAGAVRHMLVQERGGDLALCSVVPDTWLGQSWEVQDLPTAAGRLGYAVRWHGERPALLWELDPHTAELAGPVRFTAPGLDPAWSSTELRGEALLGSVPGPTEPADPDDGAGASSSFT